MEIHISHRYGCWDIVMEDYLQRQVIHLAEQLRRRGLRATTLHVSISEEGHHHTECVATLHIPGSLLYARTSNRSEFVSVRDTFRDLRAQLVRHGVRQLPRPRASADQPMLHAC